jgi:hypothetical protein
MTEGVDVTNSAWDPNFFQVGEEGSMLLTLLGTRIFSKLVKKGSMGQLCLGPDFFKVGDDNVTPKGSLLLTLLGTRFFFKLVKKGSMLLTLLGVRLFFQVGRQGTR